jgi:hypothetical protein
VARTQGGSRPEKSQGGSLSLIEDYQLLFSRIVLVGAGLLIAFEVLLTGSVFALIEKFDELGYQKAAFVFGSLHTQYNLQCNYYGINFKK